MSLTRLSLGRNNDVIYKLLLPKVSLISDIPGWGREYRKPFFTVHVKNSWVTAPTTSLPSQHEHNYLPLSFSNSRSPSLSLWSDLPASYWRGGWMSLPQPLLPAGLRAQVEARLEAGGGQDASRSLSEAPAGHLWNRQALQALLRSRNQKLYLNKMLSTWL